MKLPVVHSPLDYLDKIVSITDISKSETFFDTSIIINPPIRCFDVKTYKYIGFEIVKLFETFKYFYNDECYGQIKEDTMRCIDTFYSFIQELCQNSFKISRSVYDEIDSHIIANRNSLGFFKNRIQKLQKPNEKYVHILRKNHFNGMLYKKTNILKLSEKKNYYLESEKEITNAILSVLKKNIMALKKIRAESKNFVDSISEIFPDDESDNVFLQDFKLYKDIEFKVTEALNKYVNDTKNSRYPQTAKTKDHKILSEIILYSHIFNKEVNFFTADRDYEELAMRLRNKVLYMPIKCNINIFHKENPSNPLTSDYFISKGIINYDVNKGFIFENNL